jgi:hypothetical protein
MGLDSVYENKFASLQNFMQGNGQALKVDARRLWGAGNHVLSLFKIGMADWYLEAIPLVTQVRADFNRIGDQYPSPFSGSSTTRQRERKTQMLRIVQTLGDTIEQFGPHIPKNTGPASPVIAFWNNGNLVPAIYIAGRWKAARTFWDQLLGSWGYDDASREDRPLNPDNLRFPGDNIY